MGNKVDFLTLDNIRAELKEFLEPTKQKLSQFFDMTVKHMEAMESEARKFMKSGNLPTDVWQWIQGNKDVTMSEVLDRVHSSIYPTQTLIDSLQMDHYDIITLISSDASILYDTAELSVSNHKLFDRVVFTNADRTREAKYALMDCTASQKGILSRCSRAKLFLNWASKQLDSLNRIDSMIRLKQKIGEQSFYESLVSNSTLTI